MPLKIQYASDLHLEFGGRKGELLLARTDADVLILAGDISTGVQGILWAGELARERDVPVIYVPGNHEFYGRVHEYALKEMRDAAEEHGVHLLDCDELILDGVRFLGATLWTDYKAAPEIRQGLAMQECEDMMNDHRRIRTRAGNRYRKFLPKDAAGLHIRAREWLTENLAEPYQGTTVVITHHGPAPECQCPEYPVDALSGAYWSDLTDLFDPQAVQLWIYGHTHGNVDTRVNGVRLSSNQPGYPGETPSGKYDPDKVVQL